MQIRSLKDTSFKEIMGCFFQAFQNYHVELSEDHGYFEERWRIANVNYSLSFGAFYHGALVGFVLNAIGSRDGLLTAYNACTGVLPEFRGQKLVKSIYGHAIPILKANDIQRCTLEVITENIRAIKAYKNVGFEITKHFNCFSGTLDPEPMEGYVLLENGFNREAMIKLPNQKWYSWENHALTIVHGNFRYFEIIVDGTVESYFVIASNGGYVAQLDILTYHPNAWSRLLSGLSEVSGQIKINNVDDRLQDKITNLLNAGLENKLNQFEMEMSL